MYFNVSFAFSVKVIKEEPPEIQKKTYKWNTKEEAKQAFKELLKEKVGGQEIVLLSLHDSNEQSSSFLV